MNDVFVPKVEAQKPGLNLGIIMGKSKTKGEVGIEIEVEGKNLLHEDDTPAPWAYHHDGSLRGEENAEYVLRHPIAFSDVHGALTKLFAACKKKKSKFDDSNRTSVHVHLNVQDFHLNRLASFLGMYFTLEEILTEWCGEYRVGNLFCLRAIDAQGIISWTKRFIKNDGQSPLPEVLHYAALNTNALKKFGSLEFRQLRGTTDPEIIEQWVRILQRLYELSADFPDPREICTMVSSGGGPLVFFDTVLGDMASVVRNGIGYNEQDIRDSIYVGIRLAQDICYCRDWALYKPMPLKPDPFNRNMKKVAQKVMQSQGIEATTLIYDVESGQQYAVQSGSILPGPSFPQEAMEEQPEPEYDDYPQESEPDWELE